MVRHANDNIDEKRGEANDSNFPLIYLTRFVYIFTFSSITFTIGYVGYRCIKPVWNRLSNSVLSY